MKVEPVTEAMSDFEFDGTDFSIDHKTATGRVYIKINRVRSRACIIISPEL